ncbi:ribosome-associated translation inhibitor RaiA [bacterium]|nr:MAG: ribosome-associated translation inhibitor RaiA [bacterium]
MQKLELRIAARHFDITPEVRSYAEKRILPLTKFFDKIIDTQLTITQNRGNRYLIELLMSVSGRKLFSKVEDHDLFTGIDKVAHKMERLLKDFHDKVRNNKKH